MSPFTKHLVRQFDSLILPLSKKYNIYYLPFPTERLDNDTDINTYHEYLVDYVRTPKIIEKNLNRNYALQPIPKEFPTKYI